MDSTHFPPGPKSRLLVGHLLELRRDPLGYLTSCAHEYGDVVGLHVANVPLFLLNHPDHIKQVLVTDNSNFIKDKGMRNNRRLFGQGLLTSEGDFWLRQRRLIQPAFHRQRVADYGSIMVDYTERMLASWQAGDTRDIHQDMMRLTLKIVTKTLFDEDITNRAEEASAALNLITQRFSIRGNIFQFIAKFFPSPGRQRFRRAVQQLDEIIYSIIGEHRAHKGATFSLLSMLLHAQDEDGNRITDQQLRDEVMTIFLAGHETTALALSWSWYLLAQHPEVEARLAVELNEALDGRAPRVDDLPRLPYTEMVIRESMRLYPPVWSLGREALRACEIGGYQVSPGTQIVISQWIMHRDARYFDNPEAFIPERWANDMIKRLPEYVYFPFGGGPRLCIGNSFAMMELVLLLASIARTYRLALVPGHPVIPWPSITLRPRNGIRVVLSRR